MSVNLLEEASRRLDSGDPASSHMLAERILEASRSSGSPERIAAAALLVGKCLYVLGDVAGARALVEEALALDEAAGDPSALGADLNLIGVLEATVGRSEEAAAVLRRSYELRAQAHGEDDPETIESLNNLGAALWRTGAAEEAIGLHEEALRRCERSLGEDHRRTAETLNALAVKLASRSESRGKARELYERGLAAAEAALGPDAELVARLLANVATARIDDDERESASPLLDRALELHERHFGSASRWTAHVLTVQGNLAKSEGRFDDARQAFERAFVIQAKELGVRDSVTLDTALGLMSVVADVAGEAHVVDERDPRGVSRRDDAMAEASALYLPLLALHPDLAGAGPGGMSPDPAQAEEQLHLIAERIATRRPLDAAQAAAAERARELTEGADSSYLEGDVASAVGRLREAIAVLEGARGPKDTSLVEPLQRLKLMHRIGGTESEVLPILRRIAAILANAYGELHPLAIRALGEVYWQERREYGPAGGKETAARIETLMRDALGEESALWRFVRQVLSAAREAVPSGAQLEEPPLSVRRERILAQRDPLADELLSDLDAVPWVSLDHAYGPAIDTPLHLRVLLAADERVREDALALLGESLLHQGSVYPATVPAVRLVRQLGSDARVPGRAGLIGFLGAAYEIAREAPRPTSAELADALNDLPELLRSFVLADPEPDVREAAAQVLSCFDE